MEDLQPFDTDYMIEPFGLRNMGATCYWNALYQGLLSLTSLHEVLIDEEYSENKFLDILRSSFKLAHPGYKKKIVELDSDKKTRAMLALNQSSSKAWKVMYEKAQTRSDLRKLTTGQQCAGEGYHMFLDLVEHEPGIMNLFMHRYERTIHCPKCDKIVSRNRKEYGLFEVDPQLESRELKDGKEVVVKEARLDKFVKFIKGYVEDYRCPECGDKSPKQNSTSLVMVPEVLTIMSKKFKFDRTARKLNVVTDFPEVLMFPGTDGKDIRYEAVAQIEHSGGASGGHYWAVCKRAGGWFTLNDNSVSPGKFSPGVNTYIVFYHAVR